MAISARSIGVLLVREEHPKLRNEVTRFCRGKKSLANTRKLITRRLDRRRFHMAIGTNLRRRSLTREELLAVTTQARLMLRVFSHIRKSVIALAHVLPILRGKRVT